MAAVLSVPSARALVSLEDGREHIFVDGTAEMAYDSNLFANARNQGSTSVQGTLSAEMVRRAGWIGVNIKAGVNWARYSQFSAQDYVDPKVSAELTKQTGRTTGSLTDGGRRVRTAPTSPPTRGTGFGTTMRGSIFNTP